jgi:O-antigen ligase
MAPVITFCLAALLSTKGRWRLIALAGLGLCTLALLASQVRSGLPALIAGGVVVLALFQLSRGFPGARLGITAAALVCAVGATAVAFTLALGSDQARERYTVLTTPGKDPSVQRRLQKWRDTLDTIRDAPFGEGMGASGRGLRFQRFRSLSTSNLDNSYLKIAFDQGIFVLLLFAVAVLLLLYGLAYRALATVDPAKAGVAIGACGALTAFLVMCGTGIYIEGLPALAVWMLVGIGVGQFTTPDRAPA